MSANHENRLAAKSRSNRRGTVRRIRRRLRYLTAIRRLRIANFSLFRFLAGTCGMLQ
jgi:hypothetical protein